MGLGSIHTTKKEAETEARRFKKFFLKRNILNRRIVVKPVPTRKLKELIRPNYWKNMSIKDKKQYGVYFFNKK